MSHWQSIWPFRLFRHEDVELLLKNFHNRVVNFGVHRRKNSLVCDFASEDKPSSNGGGHTYRLTHQGITTRCSTLAWLYPSAWVAPALFLLVFNDEVVTHNDQVSVVSRMLHSLGHDVTESVQAAALLPFFVFSFKNVFVLVETQETHWPCDRDKGVFN